MRRSTGSRSYYCTTPSTTYVASHYQFVRQSSKFWKCLIYDPNYDPNYDLHFHQWPYIKSNPRLPYCTFCGQLNQWSNNITAPEPKYEEEKDAAQGRLLLLSLIRVYF